MVLTEWSTKLALCISMKFSCNEAINHVIAKQEALGLQAVTDGEFRRANYFVRFNERVNGYTMMESNISFDEDDKQITYLSPAVTDKLEWVESVAADELAYSQTQTDKTIKITLPSPADQQTLLNQYITLINNIAQNAPPTITLAMHMCRGNNQGEWLFSGGYDAVAEALFSQVAVDSLFLEYDSDRAGTFEPLCFIPRNKFVVLGLVTSKAPQLEQEDDLVKRIEEASAYFPLERMGLSPQCGFASTLPGNPLDEAAQWEKLALIVATARRVWDEIAL